VLDTLRSLKDSVRSVQHLELKCLCRWNGWLDYSAATCASRVRSVQHRRCVNTIGSNCASSTGTLTAASTCTAAVHGKLDLRTARPLSRAPPLRRSVRLHIVLLPRCMTATLVVALEAQSEEQLTMIQNGQNVDMCCLIFANTVSIS
jgi:hypothetical protein